MSSAKNPRPATAWEGARRVETFGNYTARTLVTKNVATSLIFNESLITSGSDAISDEYTYSLALALPAALSFRASRAGEAEGIMNRRGIDSGGANARARSRAERRKTLLPHPARNRETLRAPEECPRGSILKFNRRLTDLATPRCQLFSINVHKRGF